MIGSLSISLVCHALVVCAFRCGEEEGATRRKKEEQDETQIKCTNIKCRDIARKKATHVPRHAVEVHERGEPRHDLDTVETWPRSKARS